VEWVVGDLEDRQALRKLVNGAGTVVHLAGVVRAIRSDEFDGANRGGTVRLISALRDVAPQARLVHVSSLAAVGPSTVPGGLSPDAKPHPISDYGKSKLAAEREVRAATCVNPWTIVRPPAIFGPRDTDVFEFFKMASLGFALVPFGDRWTTVAYVSDVVRGILAAAVGEACRVHHVGEPQPRRIEDLIRDIADAGRVKVRVIKVPSTLVRLAGAGGWMLWKVGVRGTALTPDKARELVARHWTAITKPSMDALGIDEWTPFVDAARETWTWYRKQRWLS
jgi:nucleoside-diphosphate-sugar epimerase